MFVIELVIVQVSLGDVLFLVICSISAGIEGVDSCSEGLGSSPLSHKVGAVLCSRVRGFFLFQKGRKLQNSKQREYPY